MKYRIVTKDGRFRIQKYSWFMWRDLVLTSYDRDGEFRDVVEYRTLEEAQKFVNSTADEKWKVVE